MTERSVERSTGSYGTATCLEHAGADEEVPAAKLGMANAVCVASKEAASLRTLSRTPLRA